MFNRASAADFDENFYLNLYPDVKAHKRRFGVSGYRHWLKYGKAEGRLHSRKKLTHSEMPPSIGQGIFYPSALVSQNFRSRYKPSKLEKRPDTLLIFLPDLKKDLIFAGYESFFKDIASIRDGFDETFFVVFNTEFDALALPDFLQGTVVSLSEYEKNPFKPKLVVTFDARTNLYAIENLGLRDISVYYCQDLEAGFHPFGSIHLWSLRSVVKSKYLVVSTKDLNDDLVHRGLIEDQAVCIVDPAITTIVPHREPSKLVFCYFRPEFFNSRNLAEHIWVTIQDFCAIRTGWTFLLVGTQGTNFEMQVNGNLISVVSKLPKSTYLSYLEKSFLTISFIFSSHPGVFAYQSAYSGIKTITNTFGPRTKEVLQARSKNLVGVDLVRDDLLQTLLTETSKNTGMGTRKPEPVNQADDQFRIFIEKVIQKL